MVGALISRMDRWIATWRPDYYALLLPGVTEARLDEFESRLPFSLPDAFRRLYLWRDGQAPTSSSPLWLNRSFMCLEEIASTKEMLDGMIDEDFDDPSYWRRGWLPFLHNGGGSHLCLDLPAEDGGTPGQLIAFWKADSDRPVEYPSLVSWLEDLVRSMESGTLELA